MRDDIKNDLWNGPPAQVWGILWEVDMWIQQDQNVYLYPWAVVHARNRLFFPVLSPPCMVLGRIGLTAGYLLLGIYAMDQI